MTAQRPLQFFAYGIGEIEGWTLPATQSALLDALAGVRACRSTATAASRTAPTSSRAFYEEVQAQRDELPFEIDGVVYKVNALDAAARARVSSRASRAGRSRTSFRPRRWRPSSSASTSRSGAPARSRRSRG